MGCSFEGKRGVSIVDALQKKFKNLIYVNQTKYGLIKEVNFTIVLKYVPKMVKW